MKFAVASGEGGHSVVDAKSLTMRTRSRSGLSPGRLNEFDWSARRQF